MIPNADLIEEWAEDMGDGWTRIPSSSFPELLLVLRQAEKAEASVDELRRALDLIVNQPPGELLIPAGWTIAEANAARMLDIARAALVRVGLPAEPEHPYFDEAVKAISEPMTVCGHEFTVEPAPGLPNTMDGLPPDLAKVLRDQSVVVSQDGAIFDLIAKWANAPSDTAGVEESDEQRAKPNTDRQQPGEGDAA